MAAARFGWSPAHWGWRPAETCGSQVRWNTYIVKYVHLLAVTDCNNTQHIDRIIRKQSDFTSTRYRPMFRLQHSKPSSGQYITNLKHKRYSVWKCLLVARMDILLLVYNTKCVKNWIIVCYGCLSAKMETLSKTWNNTHNLKFITIVAFYIYDKRKKTFGEQDSSVGIVIIATGWTVRGSSSSRNKISFSAPEGPDRLWGPLSLFSVGTGCK